MDGERNQRPVKREITYRVGWKKGKLEIGENGRVTGAESGVVFLEKALWLRLLDRYVWKRAPFVPERALPALLWTLPAVSFGFVWWLVFMLSKP